MQTDNINFTGLLYGKAGQHLTKGIYCCKHGDAKFVRTFNRIAAKNPEAIKISAGDTLLKKAITIETTGIPKLSLLEKIIYLANPLQGKAVKMRKQGKLQSFVYRIDETEFDFLRCNYPFILPNTLKKFTENVKKLAPDDIQDYLKHFFL